MHNDISHYKYLPAFSEFLLNERLDPFVKVQLEIAYEVDLPIMKKLVHFSEEQLLEISRISMVEYLGYLAKNQARVQIETSLEKWIKDELELIGKFELLAEDITLINFVRFKAFRRFIPEFTKDQFITLELIDELDSFITSSTTSATDTYIDLLKDQIAKHENELLEAQKMAHIGNFEWVLNGQSSGSPEIYRIFEMEKGTGFETFMQYVHPEDREHVEQLIQQAFKNGKFESEYRYIKNGKTKNIWSKGKVFFNNSLPIKMVGTVQDITEQKKAERALQEKTVALERSNESLQQFAYVASHDLKEPVRKIATFTDLVLNRESSLSDSARTSLQKVYHSAVRMRQMIDDIMAYSTLMQWEDKIEYSLNDVVKEAVEILEQALEDKNARIEFSQLPTVCMVPAQFRQLFQNLISNSLKFSKPDVPPVITISYQWLQKDQVNEPSILEANKYISITVTDNGIGFEQEASEKIFLLFSRLHAKTEYEGSGLGLAIAKRIIDNHNGVIHAKGEKGNGASFQFIIPQ